MSPTSLSAIGLRFEGDLYVISSFESSNTNFQKIIFYNEQIYYHLQRFTVEEHISYFDITSYDKAWCDYLW